MFSYIMATAAILDIKSHPNRQQCYLWRDMMCLCENNQFESCQIQMGETNHYVLSGYIWYENIECVMLKQQPFEIGTNAQNF